MAFLAANAKRLGIQADLSGLRPQRLIESLGAFHVIFQQVLANQRSRAACESSTGHAMSWSTVDVQYWTRSTWPPLSGRAPQAC